MTRLLVLLLVLLTGVGGARAQAVPSAEDFAAYHAYVTETDPVRRLERGRAFLAAMEAKGASSETVPLRLDVALTALEAGAFETALALLEPLLAVPDLDDEATARALDLAAKAYAAMGEDEDLVAALEGRLRVLGARLGDAGGTVAAARDDAAARLRARGLETQAAALDLPPKTKAANANRFALAEGQKAKPASDHVLIDVYYGTDRARTGDVDPANFYSGEAATLELGRASVSVPMGKRGDALPAPSWWRFEPTPDPARHVLLQTVEPLDREVFAKLVRLNGAGRDGLLFIHGFNTGFATAMRRAGQLAFDMEFPGPAFAYSWPSQNALWGYYADADKVLGSTDDVAAFLELIAGETGVERLHVVAHSMGNRFLLAALERLRGAMPRGLRLGEVIMAAPDVGRDDLAARFAALAPMARGFTLYASKTDLALKVSRQVNAEPRAGDASFGLPALDGLDAIDATPVAEDFLGHNYFGDADAVLADLIGTLTLDWRPDERCSVAMREAHWQLTATGCGTPELRVLSALVTEAGGIEGAFQRLRQRIEDAGADTAEDVLALWQKTAALVP